LLPNGRMVLDTPGMRELGLWDADAGLSTTFSDIESLTARCRFRDCAHEAEPGCAVQAALTDGSLNAGRWRNYAKLQREISHHERKDDPRARAEQRKRWSRIARSQRLRARLRTDDE
jgi:ribosome biogenesis GTPase